MLIKNRTIPTLPTTPLGDIFRLTSLQKIGLKKLSIITAGDLLYYFPIRYGNPTETKYIHACVPHKNTTVYGRIISIKNIHSFKSHIPMTEAEVEDGTGRIRVLWLHQEYIAKIFKIGALVKLSGEIKKWGTGYCFLNPEIIAIKEFPINLENSIFNIHTTSSPCPIYPETKNITSRFIHNHIQKLFISGLLDRMPDKIPDEIRTHYNLPSLKTALVWIHTPQKEQDAKAARKRFAFEEIFLIQLERQQERAHIENQSGVTIIHSVAAVKKFRERFPFIATVAQERALTDIFSDLEKGTPMSRLLEGDVGSGKTFVAATTTHTVVTNAPHDNKFANLQVAYMAPTEILAKQHFKNFCEYFTDQHIEIGLLTGSTCKKFPSKTNPQESTVVSRAQLLKWVKEGSLPILIGTHALIEKSVQFKNLALVIIDEQHRFGTSQRSTMLQRESIHDKLQGGNNAENLKSRLLPHLLSMTATPIPRTLALTLYGNLDLTLLDQMPAGRLPIKSYLIIPTERKKMEDHIRTEIISGRQVFIVCPRIDEPDPEKELSLNVKSVTEEALRLGTIVFPEFNIGIIHGKMKPPEKEFMMEEFCNGKLHILVATSVIEVGVNVPNATIIVIEGAERFGLAQLHQLRGRVLRSTHQAYCYLLTTKVGALSSKRLSALVNAKNGFELAELDLMLRGAGKLSGEKQWGISDLGMEAIKNIKMVEAARNEASRIIKADPTLINHPILLDHMGRKNHNTHWE